MNWFTVFWQAIAFFVIAFPLGLGFLFFDRAMARRHWRRAYEEEKLARLRIRKP